MALKRFWQQQLGTAHIVCAPRLTAGIHAVARAIGARRAIVPNICCPQMLYGLLLAGTEPVLCDIDLANGGLNLAACEQVLAEGGANLVLHVHLYGLYSDRGAVHRLCQRYGAFLFENAAIWFPPHDNYGVLRESGIGFSFGERKPFNLGGGAVLGLATARIAADVQRVLEEQPSRPGAPSGYGTQYNNLVDEEGMPRSKAIDLMPMAERYRKWWIGSAPMSRGDLTPARVAAERDRRRRLADGFMKALSPIELEWFASHNFDFPWRLSFRSNKRRCLVRHLSDYKVPVTSLYPPLDRFFPGLPTSATLANSHTLGAQVCNIRLDPDVGDGVIARVHQAALAWGKPVPPQACGSIRGRVRRWLARFLGQGQRSRQY
jgi:dTDP-4-amino-4,6-dideoxygalactose transaminase